jgi:tetraacyldisaccharide 4'-kinase
MYSAAAVWRRQWYARQPSRRLRLVRPVISVGNLSVGGSGKTPMVGYIARLLVAAGERPAILTRGYGRRRKTNGVTVVSDGIAIRAGVDRAGDEPLMLARALPAVPVVVCPSRYRAGRVAEEQLGATVHLLDDGFQHLQMARDVDLLLVSEDDLSDRPLPGGRLREPLAAARAADAALVSAGYASAVDRVARAVGIGTSFQVTRTLGAPRTVGASPESVVVPPQARVFAVAGIARPDRFFSDVAAAGWDLVGSMGFRDHHRFTASDVKRIAAAARAAAAAIVLTTEKDAVRLEACDLNGLPVASVPLVVGVEPEAAFRAWLLERLARVDRVDGDEPDEPDERDERTRTPR